MFLSPHKQTWAYERLSGHVPLVAITDQNCEEIIHRVVHSSHHRHKIYSVGQFHADLLREGIYLPKIDSLMLKTSKHCLVCMKIRTSTLDSRYLTRSAPFGKSYSLDILYRKGGQRLVGIDIAGPFLQKGGKRQNRPITEKVWILLALDVMSRYISLYKLRSLSAESLGHTLNIHSLKINQKLNWIVSDTGSAFLALKNMPLADSSDPPGISDLNDSDNPLQNDPELTKKINSFLDKSGSCFLLTQSSSPTQLAKLELEVKSFKKALKQLDELESFKTSQNSPEKMSFLLQVIENSLNARIVFKDQNTFFTASEVYFGSQKQYFGLNHLLNVKKDTSRLNQEIKDTHKLANFIQTSLANQILAQKIIEKGRNDLHRSGSLGQSRDFLEPGTIVADLSDVKPQFGRRFLNTDVNSRIATIISTNILKNSVTLRFAGFQKLPTVGMKLTENSTYKKLKTTKRALATRESKNLVVLFNKNNTVQLREDESVGSIDGLMTIFHKKMEESSKTDQDSVTEIFDHDIFNIPSD